VSADGPDNEVDLAGEAALVNARRLAGEVDVAAGGAEILIYGADEFDRLGRSALAGDLEGDGRADLILGAPGGAGPGEAEPSMGELYVLHSQDLLASIELPASSSVQYGSELGDSFSSEVFGRPPMAIARLTEGAGAVIIVASPTADGPENGRPDSGEINLLFLAE
jgi:hypothetical protein